MIELGIHGDANFDVFSLIGIYEAHRFRFIDQLGGLSADEWSAPSRCSEWTVQQVVRHLCDINEIGLHDAAADPFQGFDPRTSPRHWLAPSDGETPAQTLSRFRAGSTAYFDQSRSAAEGGFERTVRFPFGEEPWTMLMAHGFWDSWIHERDVLLALGREHRTDDEGTRFAVGYALFVSSAVAALFGTPINSTFELSGTGRGAYEVVTDSSGAIVRVSPKDVTDGVDASLLSDALSGRGSVSDLLESPPAGLSSLADFFRTPV